MPDAEGDAGRDRRRLEGIDLVRRHHDRFVETVAIARAQNGIADDPGRAVGRDIDDLDREIRIPRARRDLQNRVDEPADLHRLLERLAGVDERSEEHTSELQSLMRISYAVFCLKKKKKTIYNTQIIYCVTRHIQIET